jgi:hypothetical protein
VRHNYNLALVAGILCALFGVRIIWSQVKAANRGQYLGLPILLMGWMLITIGAVTAIWAVYP